MTHHLLQSLTLMTVALEAMRQHASTLPKGETLKELRQGLDIALVSALRLRAEMNIDTAAEQSAQRSNQG